MYLICLYKYMAW